MDEQAIPGSNLDAVLVVVFRARRSNADRITARLYNSRLLLKRQVKQIGMACGDESQLVIPRAEQAIDHCEVLSRGLIEREFAAQPVGDLGRLLERKGAFVSAPQKR